MINIKDMPAFPCGRDVTLDQFAPSSGLTIRDYFAAKALAALITCAENHGDLPHSKGAVDAYRYADAAVEAMQSKPLPDIEMALRVAKEYCTKDSQIDSGNLYAALRQCLDYIAQHDPRR